MTELMKSQYWFRYIDPDLCHHMVSLGHNELKFHLLGEDNAADMIFCSLNTLRFMSHILKCIFFNENYRILIPVSQTFVESNW